MILSEVGIKVAVSEWEGENRWKKYLAFFFSLTPKTKVNKMKN